MAEVSVSKRYDVPGAEIWERIGDPRDICRWHPAIAETDMAADDKRINTRTDGGRVSETILEQGERHHTYRIDESPLPLEGFVATLAVRDEHDCACIVEWRATFHPIGISDAKAAELTRGFFQEGLDAL